LIKTAESEIGTIEKFRRKFFDQQKANSRSQLRVPTPWHLSAATGTRDGAAIETHARA
jgi:hypothetical protein